MATDPEKSLQPNHSVVDDSSSNTARPSHKPSMTDLQKAEAGDGETAVPPAASTTVTEGEKGTDDARRDVVEKHTDTAPEEDESHYPHGFKLLLISLSLCFAVFLVALVRLRSDSCAESPFAPDCPG